MSFLAISTLDELAQFLGRKDYESLKGLIYPSPFYTTFELTKKSGGVRLIEAPGLELKKIQRKLAAEITNCFGDQSPSAHAFMYGRSVVSNALPHVNRASVVRIDLKDFFHQIHFGRVKGVFSAPPFSFPNDVATVLAHICCHEGRLPQGAPTSPPLSNFVCLPLDRHLRRLARRYKGRYTRYADDLTFSFGVLPLEKIPAELFISNVGLNGYLTTEAGPMVCQILREQGFKINSEKTRGANKSMRQMVTGVVVNEGLSLSRRYVDEIRRALFLWEKIGLVEAEKRSVPILHKKRYSSGATPSLMNLIRGKLAWLAKVTGRSSTQYRKLALKYNELVTFEERSELRIRVDVAVRNIEDAIKATWFIKARNNLSPYEEGTAFRFKGNVWITCAHCVGELASKSLYSEIKISSGEWAITDLDVRVVHVDWHRDLAILRPKPLVPVPTHLAYFESSKNAPEADMRIGVLGFPSAVEFQRPLFMRGRVVRVRGIYGVSRIEIDKTLHHGNSGGPMFDEHYRVIGIVVEKANSTGGMNSCVNVTELATLPKI